MGCGASSQPVEHQRRQNGVRLEARVQPQPQIKPYNAEPQGQHVSAAHSQHPQQQIYPAQQAPAQQSKANAPQYDEEQTEIEVRDIATTKELLQNYINIENKVKELEKTNIQQMYNETAKEVGDLNHAVAELQKRHDAAVAVCKKEKADFDEINVQSVKEMFSNETEYERQLSKEEQEWIESKNAQEVAKQELDGMIAVRDKAQAKLEKQGEEFNTLQARYKEQEELLAAVFKGKYGSDLENKLEAEHDFLVDRKQRIGAAKYKWTNGKNLLQHATQQLCVACKKWMELLQINPQDQRARYTAATEARNNMIAASQNITSAQRYLSTIDFPYCKPAELKVLEQAVANIYTDMLTNQRHQYVYANVYLMMYKRCHALVLWFDHVLTKTIAVDLAEATKFSKEKGLELRQERLNLISAKIKEDLQQDVTFEAREEVQTEEPAKDEAVEGLFQTETAVEGSEGPPPEGEVEADEPFNPKPLEEIAPTPKKEDLFGDAQELFKKHQEDLQELEKNQVLNKARQEQGLEEKLRARRSRKQRQAAIDAEKAAVQQAVQT